MDVTQYSLSSYNGSDTTIELCYKYSFGMLWANSLSYIVSYSIVGINYVLRVFIIILIKRIGYDTESGQTQIITDGVFVTQYFNTGILLLICNANLAEQGTLLGAIFSGSLPDFNSTWYDEIGYSMCYALLYNVFWPIIEFFVYYGMREAFRMLDRGFKTCNKNVTKKTTL